MHAAIDDRRNGHRQGFGARVGLLTGFLTGAALLFFLGTAHAQPGPTPIPVFPSGDGSIFASAPSTVLDIGTRFLRHLGTEASSQSAGPPRTNNPGGGGADLQTGADNPAPTEQRYRTWFEGYTMRSRMDPQGEFVGDRRRTYGGVAGFGMTYAPGMAFGVSVDQSDTRIDIAPTSQSARLQLTQIGANAAFQSGAWTLGIAGIHSFGDVDSRRSPQPNVSTANYDAKLWGALAELSYLWSSGSWRIVPKLGADWVRTEIDGFTETGGSNPVIASGLTSHLARIFGGAEIGHSWFSGQTIFDLSGYGRLVEIVDRDPGSLFVQSPNGAFTSRFVSGVMESRTGVDAGAAASYRFAPNARVYAVYDGRFRSNYESHAGTLGLEFKW